MLAAGLVAVLLLGSAYGYLLWRAFDESLQRYPVTVAPVSATQWSVPSGMNLLLVGTDDRSRLTDEEVAKYSTGRTESTLTDTIMVLHIPPSDAPAGTPVSLVSIPRDSWVDIPGYGMDKINAAFGLGGGGAEGTSLLAETVTAVTGMPIHHTLVVDFASFARITEAIGPVEVCLKEPTSDPATGLALPAGPQVLEPEDALAFVRQRQNLPNGDLDRVKRQQAYLAAAAHAIRDNLLSPSYGMDLATTVGENLFADEAFRRSAQAAAVANAAVRSLGTTVRTTTLPVADINATIGEQSVVLLDEPAIPGFVASLDLPDPTETTTETPTESATETPRETVSPSSEPSDVGSPDASPAPTATPAPSEGADGSAAESPWVDDPSCVY